MPREQIAPSGPLLLVPVALQVKSYPPKPGAGTGSVMVNVVGLALRYPTVADFLKTLDK